MGDRHLDTQSEAEMCMPQSRNLGSELPFTLKTSSEEPIGLGKSAVARSGAYSWNLGIQICDLGAKYLCKWRPIPLGAS